MAPARYDRRAVWSWAFYDFANSAFTTLVVTFVYATYFTGGVVGAFLCPHCSRIVPEFVASDASPKRDGDPRQEPRTLLPPVLRRR
jgi:MFS-type transporter involved in bile tolerance (Atg22 family)